MQRNDKSILLTADIAGVGESPSHAFVSKARSAFMRYHGRPTWCTLVHGLRVLSRVVHDHLLGSSAAEADEAVT